MRSNAMKTCAVGAMLFGGTLGVTSAASAGVVVTWTANNAFNTGSAYNIFGTSYESAVFETASTTPAVAAIGSTTYSLGTASVTYTNTASGFSMSGTGGPAAAASASRNFTISGLADGQFMTATVVLANLPYSSFIVQNAGYVPFNAWLDIPGGSGSGAGTYDIQLGNGSYYISIGVGNMEVEGTISGFNGEFASFTVPAPGAVALLGAAGLVGSRRRRN
jgi:MYXO-CTERM domain-containing protein